jgi:hypothetical protein
LPYAFPPVRVGFCCIVSDLLPSSKLVPGAGANDRKGLRFQPVDATPKL